MDLDKYKETQEILRDMIQEIASKIVPMKFSEIHCIYKDEVDNYFIKDEPNLNKVLTDLQSGYTAIPF